MASTPVQILERRFSIEVAFLFFALLLIFQVLQGNMALSDCSSPPDGLKKP